MSDKETDNLNAAATGPEKASESAAPASAEAAPAESRSDGAGKASASVENASTQGFALTPAIEEAQKFEATKHAAETPRPAAEPVPPIRTGRKLGKWIAVSFLIFVALMIALLAAARWYVFTRPVTSVTPDAPVTVMVEEGDSVRRVLTRMQHEGLDVTLPMMRIASRMMGSSVLSRLHTGLYRFEPGLTPAGIIETFGRGALVDRQLRIPDGAPIWEVRAVFRNAPALKQATAGMTDDELRRELQIDAVSLEGWFAPDTYRYSSGSTDLSVMKAAVARQKAILESAWNVRSAVLSVNTPYEALILASIIEKETGHHTDRHLISSVFNNRLAIRMPLQTDPTVIYGLGEKWNGNLTKKDLQTPTPYNTYKIQALPPTPIAAPSAASIEAALNPADTKYLYFVSRGDGTSEFTTNLRDHNRAVNRFILNKRRSDAPAASKAQP